MINYNDLYELLRKEKYSEILQQLPKDFLDEMAVYLQDKKDQSISQEEIFQEFAFKSKKQLENSIAIFKELMLRRKKKLLNLIFVATETGIMKRDYENMLAFEKEIFDTLVKTFEESDKEMMKFLQGRKESDRDEYKMVMFQQNVEKFVDMSGKIIGPFSAGELANLDADVSSILVSGGKAKFVED